MTDCFRTFWSIKSMWFQRYGKGDYHTWHDHGGGPWFGTYYVDMCGDDMATEYLDMNTNSKFSYDVKEGDVILMPGQIIHSSPAFQGNSTKTVIAFNLDCSVPSNSVTDI